MATKDGSIHSLSIPRIRIKPDLYILWNLILTHWEFFTSVLADSLSLKYQWQQVSRTLLSILVVINDAVVWMISTCPPTYKSSSPFNNPLVTVTKSLITIGIIASFMFHSFFQFSSKSWGTYPSFRFFSVLFCDQPGQQSPQFSKFSFFVVDYYKEWSSGKD